MRRNELRTARGYIEALIQANSDCNWYIEGIVTPEISEDGKTAVYFKENRRYDYQEDRMVTTLVRSHTFTSDEKGVRWDPANFPYCFGWQETHHEDCHHGQMLFPLDGKEYLLIGFGC